MFGLFSRRRNRALIDKLYGEIMAGVTQPSLYLGCGVPDTFDGRFEMLALHAGLTLRRIEQLPAPGPELAQDLTDGIFSQLDATLREMGVGDITVPKRMKKHAEAFAGRVQAYAQALDKGDEDALRLALARNALGGEDRAETPEAYRLTRYARAVDAALSSYDIDHFTSGRVGFPAPPTTGAP